jgi:hypothetical protein
MIIIITKERLCEWWRPNELGTASLAWSVQRSSGVSGAEERWGF